MRQILQSLLLAMIVCGCSEQATLAVAVQTDFVPEVEFASIRVSIETPAGDLSQTHMATAADYARGQRIATFPNLPPGEFRIFAQVLADDGRVLGERNSVGPVSGITGVSVVIARSCASVRCPAADETLTECSGGRCVAPECTPENPAACPTGCMSDEECDSTIECAAGFCSAEGSCLEAPIPGACQAEEYCDFQQGCRPRPRIDGGTRRDSGSPDGGVDALQPDASIDCMCSISEDECRIDGCYHAQTCNAVTACPTGYGCEEGQCRCEDLGECGVQCTADSQCAALSLTPQCDEVTRRCRTALHQCLLDADCTDGACLADPSTRLGRCVHNGTGMPGEMCSSNQECASGRCRGVCALPCFRNSDCPGTLICSEENERGACIVGHPDCALCSGTCDDGECSGALCNYGSDCGDAQYCRRNPRPSAISGCYDRADCQLNEFSLGDGSCAISQPCWPASPVCPAGYICNADDEVCSRMPPEEGKQ